MYKVMQINEYGQVYSCKGLLQFHDEQKDKLFLEFPTLEKAKRYCYAFVNRYPHVICNIHKEDFANPIIESIEDKKYWELYGKNTKEWQQINKKAERLVQNVTLVVVVFVSIIFGMISHFLGEYGVSLWLKLIILPVLSIATGKILFWVFPKVL